MENPRAAAYINTPLSRRRPSPHPRPQTQRSIDYLCVLSVTTPEQRQSVQSLQSHSFEQCMSCCSLSASGRSGLMTAEILSDQAHHIHRTRAARAIQSGIFMGLEERVWKQSRN
jgi:hypothetical protein